MDEETQKHLDLGQDAALSSIGSKSTTPGTKVNTDMAETAETTRCLEQAYSFLIQHFSEEDLSTMVRMSVLLIKKARENDTEMDEEVREMDEANKGAREVSHSPNLQK